MVQTWIVNWNAANENRIHELRITRHMRCQLRSSRLTAIIRMYIFTYIHTYIYIYIYIYICAHICKVQRELQIYMILISMAASQRSCETHPRSMVSKYIAHEPSSFDGALDTTSMEGTFGRATECSFSRAVECNKPNELSGVVVVRSTLACVNRFCWLTDHARDCWCA